MGRKKKKLRRQQARARAFAEAENQRESSYFSNKHQEFLDLMDTAGFTMPWQLNNWRKFFVSEGSFLKAAEYWLSARLEGRFVRIEDDIDKGLMTAAGPTVYRPNTNYGYGQQSGGWADDDYGWENAWHQTGFGYVEKLPLTPKLDAPSGSSGAVLVIL